MNNGKVKPVKLGISIAATAAIIGLIFGVFGFFAMNIASEKAESSIDSVFTFMKASDTNVAMFGGMTTRIAKYAGDSILEKAKKEKCEETIKTINELFPIAVPEETEGEEETGEQKKVNKVGDNEVEFKNIDEYEPEDIIKVLNGIQGITVPLIKKNIACIKTMMLFALPFIFAFLGFFIGLIGGKFYNIFNK